MKFKLLILVFFCLFVFSADKTNAKINFPLHNKIIIIDAGHGGLDGGTSKAGIQEKDINLAIALYLEKELNKKGATVIMTRSGDYDLSFPNATWRKKSDFDNRINLINNSKANLYVSIHLNAIPQTEYSGAQVFYSKRVERNKQIAEIIQKTLNKELKNDRLAMRIPTDTYMYSRLNPPGVLIECGFLSNASERAKLKTSEYQKKLAEVITRGIIRAI